MNKTCEQVAEKIVVSFVAERREKDQAAKSAAMTAENVAPLNAFADAMSAALKKHAPDLSLKVGALPWKYDGKEMSGGLTVNESAVKVIVTPGQSAVAVNGNRVEQGDLWNVVAKEVRRLLDSSVAA